MENGSLNLENVIKGFRLCCQTEGKSPWTIEWYYAFLTRFRRFMEPDGVPTTLELINRDHVRRFIRYLQTEARTPHTGKPLSPATVQGYARCLKAFFSWAEREGYIQPNQIARIPIPKAPVKVINTFSSEQIVSLMEVCQRSNGCGYRNLTAVLLMLDTGLRVSELVGIGLEDVNLTEGQIKITGGKGGRERVVPIGSLVQKSLWKYINQVRPQPLTQKTTRLFLSDIGLPLTRNGVQQMVRRCGKIAGLTGVRCSPHTFRHTFAKNYLLNGGDIFSLQKILGHSSLASVRAYVNLFSGDVKKQHNRFSPVDNLTQNSQIYRLCHLPRTGHQPKCI